MTPKRAVVLGCGLMGRTMAADLAASGCCEVMVVDRRQEAVDAMAAVPGVRALRMDVVDLAGPDSPVRSADLVVGALPGSLGYSVLRRVIEAGCPLVVDISFMPEDPRGLDGLARERGATVVVDAGVAPGLSHMLVGSFVAEAGRASRVRILVGGLPVRRSWPLEYLTVFSPRDVLEEYVRPARVRRGGHVLSLPALSEVELVEVEGLGTLEAFLTDGLRSLLVTTPVPFMEEKTLRYPGHAEKIRLLRELGFLGSEFVRLPDGTLVRPVDIALRLFEEAWRPRPDDRDLTVLRVEVEGVDSAGVPAVWRADLLDRADEAGRTSMARTTGFTATAVATWLLTSGWRRPGVVFPEELAGVEGALPYVLGYLATRGVQVRTGVSPQERAHVGEGERRA